MNTINCRIKRDEYTDVAGNDVTPMEVLVVRGIYGPVVKGDPITGAYKGGVALRNGQPRTVSEEFQRLLARYPAKNNKTDKFLVEEILGAALARMGKYPETFEELSRLDPRQVPVSISISKPASAEEKQAEKVTWGSKPEGEEIPVNVIDPEAAARTELSKLSKSELSAKAAELGATVEETDTKAKIIEKILVESGAKAEA